MPDDTTNGRRDDDDWGDADPQHETESAPPVDYRPAYLGDRHFYRVIGWGLVSIVGLTVIGSIGLAAFDKDIPESVIAIGSTAIGACND